jgi:2-hydroxychromene-2-carboxylate isomerase
MPAPIEFHFDFSSPYGYFAATRIDALASRFGRSVTWKPILLGVVFKTTGGAPLPALPLKGDYAKKDIPRCARFMGIPFRFPSPFPVGTVGPVRAFYWAEGNQSAMAILLAQALFKAYFVDNLNISDNETVVRVAASVGLDADAVRAGMNDAAARDRTRAETELAVSKGVCGSPYFIVDGEPFWGHDRLDQVERWLDKGPY